MAEVVGLVSAGIGIAPFLLQVGTGINKIRKTIGYHRHQASVDLESVAADFEKLQKSSMDIENRSQDFHDDVLIALAIDLCQQWFNDIEAELDRLSRIFETPKGRLKSLKMQLMSNAEKSVKDIRMKVQEIMKTLLSISIRLGQLESSQVKQIGPVPSVTTGSSPATDHTQTHNTSVGISSFHSNRSMTRRRRLGASVGGACSHNQMSYISKRFWWLEYSPTIGPWHKCSDRCNTKYQWGAKLRLALTWFNIPYAVTASFAFTCDNGQYGLRPALDIQHVVKNTSPGFEALFLCRQFHISVDECKSRLRNLYQSDKTFKYHVNPAGKSYLRHLVSHPWGFQGDQFELLDFFLSELDVDFTAEDPGFLIDCSRWIGEGWHLPLLDTILNHGFEPVSLDPPATNRWPEPCSPDWRCESITADPFFLEYFALILYHEPQFAGVTDIQALISSGSSLPCPGPENSNQRERFFMVNFLAQSALHLAVGNLQVVKMLLDLGHGLDVTDSWGVTPLMYAAAYGFEEVAAHLLLKGANACLKDLRFNRTFFDYAIVRGHWNLIHKTLLVLEDMCRPEEYQIVVKFVVARAMSSRISITTEDIRRHHVSELIRLCDNVNFSVAGADSVTGNCLMHYAETVEEAEALVSRGFDRFNQPNSDGMLAIHSRMRNREVFNFCLDHGTDINHLDSEGQTLLFELLSKLQNWGATQKLTLQQIRSCLSRGADHRRSDDCRCPCSPEGCSSSAIFKIEFTEEWSFQDLRPDILCALEWQSMLREVLGEEAAKEFLLSLIRRIEFDELGMSHVCCHRGVGMRSRSDSWMFEPYPEAVDEENAVEILEEEGDFIDILDQTMGELALKPVNDLQQHLLGMMKKRYDEHLQRYETRTTSDSGQSDETLERPPSWNIDHKNDEFVQQFSSISSRMEHCMPRSLATYIVHLDLELFTANDSVTEVTERNAWYSWRIDWMKEVIGIFRLSTADVAAYFDDEISHVGRDLDEQNKKQIKDRFMSCCGTGDS